MEGLFILGPLLVIIIWFFIFKLDKARIRSYFDNRGDTVLSIHWRLFGKGWLSESDNEGGGNRIYKVEFKDLYGNIKQAWCKTAMLSGVFLSDEEITVQAQSNGDSLTPEGKIVILEDELKRLRSSKE